MTREWTDIGDGYFTRFADCPHVAIIRRAGRFNWYGGAARHDEASVPLHGPYWFRWMARMEARGHRRDLIYAAYWEKHGSRTG